METGECLCLEAPRGGGASGASTDDNLDTRQHKKIKTRSKMKIERKLVPIMGKVQKAIPQVFLMIITIINGRTHGLDSGKELTVNLDTRV